MFHIFRVGLLFALVFGLCVSASNSSTRLCIVSLDTCCDVRVASCETQSDCCEEGTHDCCLSVLSDESFAKVPEGLPATALNCIPVCFLDTFALARDGQIVIRTVLPDPPPLSASDRLVRLELFLI